MTDPVQDTSPVIPVTEATPLEVGIKSTFSGNTDDDIIAFMNRAAEAEKVAKSKGSTEVIMSEVPVPQAPIAQDEIPTELPLVADQPEPVKELTELEKQAVALGWDPNHKGASFVDADEFVRRQPLFERIERQNRELKELKELQRLTASHLTAIRKDAYDKIFSDLTAQRDQAVANGDTARFKLVDAQIRDTAQKMAQDPLVKVQTYTETPKIEGDIVNLTNDFKTRNAAWYNAATPENELMVEAANSWDLFLIKKARLDQGLKANEQPKIDAAAHFKAIEAKVKEQFSHRFENTNRDLPPTVARSQTPRSTKSTNADLVSRLTPEQLYLGQQFQRYNPAYTLDKYAADLHTKGQLKTNTRAR